MTPDERIDLLWNAVEELQQQVLHLAKELAAMKPKET